MTAEEKAACFILNSRPESTYASTMVKKTIIKPPRFPAKSALLIDVAMRITIRMTDVAVIRRWRNITHQRMKLASIQNKVVMNMRPS